MDSPGPFQYLPLKASEIRLLTLKPGKFEGPIHCSLKHIPLGTTDVDLKFRDLKKEGVHGLSQWKWPPPWDKYPLDHFTERMYRRTWRQLVRKVDTATPPDHIPLWNNRFAIAVFEAVPGIWRQIMRKMDTVTSPNHLPVSNTNIRSAIPEYEAVSYM
jgi:hypothetical protein